MKYQIITNEPPRNSVVIEHALGQYAFGNGDMLELVEVVGRRDSDWRQMFEWRLCQTFG